MTMNFECPICTEMGDARGTERSGLCMVADCGHVFHIKCIKHWQSLGNKTCPVCRRVCRRTWTLYGSTENADASAEVNNGAPQQEDTAEITELYTTLLDDHDKLKARYKTALDEARVEMLRADEKHRELATIKTLCEELRNKLVVSEVNLAAEKSRTHTLTEELKISGFKISMFEDEFGIGWSKRIDDIIAGRDNDPGDLINLNN